MIYHCLVWPSSRALIATAANITFLELSRRLRRLYSPDFDRRSSNHLLRNSTTTVHRGDPSFLPLLARGGERGGGGGGKKKGEKEKKEGEGCPREEEEEDRKKEGQGWGQFDRNANIRVRSMVVDDNEVWNWKRIRGKLLGTPVSYTNSRFVRCYLPFSFQEFRGINRKLVVKVEVEDGVVVVRIRTGTSVIKVEVNARNIGRERERERERERGEIYAPLRGRRHSKLHEIETPAPDRLPF